MEISVAQKCGDDPLAFDIVIRDGKGESRYSVTMARETHDRLASGHTAEDVVEAAFKFLLDREPKESILMRFDITVVERYFPEFDQELPRYLR
jgi:hypothetical protein